MAELTIAFVHTLLAIGAGFLLWKIWRCLALRDRTAGLIIGAGFILRALSAQVLFWVSYLHLPIARDLQLGDGFWKFAIDGEVYFGAVRTMLREGWHAVVLVDRTLPSPVFLQSLAGFVFLFGGIASVGALLNLFAYLGGCAAILRIGRSEGQSHRPTLIALMALSFSPSLVIWSALPLKDAFFASAVAAFVAGCTLWHRAWQSKSSVPFLRFAAAFALLLASLYAIVGIRWYFGVLLCFVSVPFFIATILASGRRAVSVFVNVAVFAVMLRTVAIGGGPYLPLAFVNVLRGSASPQTVSRASHDMISLMAKSRHAFEATPARTQIHVGRALLSPKATIASPPPAVALTPTSVPLAAATATPLAATAPPLAAAAPPLAATAAPLAAKTASPTHAPVRAAAKVIEAPRVEKRGDGPLPHSAGARIVAGTVAVIVPRFAGEALGIIDVTGEGGFWPMVDADTLMFDLLLLYVLFQVIRGIGAGAMRNAAFWLVGFMTVGITILLTYTISNFGTLFRHRSMIFVGLCLLLVVTARRPHASPRPEPAS